MDLNHSCNSSRLHQGHCPISGLFLPTTSHCLPARINPSISECCEILQAVSGQPSLPEPHAIFRDGDISVPLMKKSSRQHKQSFNKSLGEQAAPLRASGCSQRLTDDGRQHSAPRAKWHPTTRLTLFCIDVTLPPRSWEATPRVEMD